MRLVLRILGVAALLIALASAGLAAFGMAVGESVAQPLGQIWFAVDPGSLNAFQAIVERRIWAPLWDHAIFPVLRQQAVLVILLGLIAGFVLLLLARIRRNGRKRLFNR